MPKQSEKSQPNKTTGGGQGASKSPPAPGTSTPSLQEIWKTLKTSSYAKGSKTVSPDSKTNKPPPKPSQAKSSPPKPSQATSPPPQSSSTSGAADKLGKAAMATGGIAAHSGVGIVEKSMAKVLDLGSMLWDGAGYAVDLVGDGSYLHDKAANGYYAADILDAGAKDQAGQAAADLEKALVYGGTAGENITESLTGQELSQVDPSRFMDKQHQQAAGGLIMTGVTVGSAAKSIGGLLSSPSDASIAYTGAMSLPSLKNALEPSSGGAAGKSSPAPGSSAPAGAPAAPKGNPGGVKQKATAPQQRGATGDNHGELPKAKKTLDDPASRAGFLLRLLPAGLRFGLSSGAEVMTRAQQLGWVEKGGEAGEPARAILRCEAAKVMGKAGNWRGSLAPGNVAFFSDVPQEPWYFDVAHEARLHGVFLGTQDNRFLATDALTAETAQLVLGRFATASSTVLPRDQQIAHLNPGVKIPEKPRSTKDLLYPGKDGSDQEKYDYFVQLVELAGFGASLGRENGQINLVGIRGLVPDNLQAMDAKQTRNKFDDMFVALGKDKDGNFVVKEYIGSTDPGNYKSVVSQFGGSENWMLKEGAYEYGKGGDSYKGQYGKYFRMTGDQTSKRGVDLHVDADGDNAFGGTGDLDRNEKDNSAFLIHYGGSKEDGPVSGEGWTWSAGCQVIPGQNADGSSKMNELAATLEVNTDSKFNYILIDGTRIAKLISG